MLNDWNGQVLPHPPRRRPVIGDVVGLDRRKTLQSALARGRDLGPIFELQVFGQKLVFVTGGRLAAEMCDESTFTKGMAPAQLALRDVVGDGLFTAYNEEPNWQLAHDLLMPAFARTAMQSYHEVMLGTVREMFDYWSVRPGPIDVSRDMTKVTLESISRAAFGQDFGSFNNETPHPFVQAMVDLLQASQRKSILNAVPGGSLIRRGIERRIRSQNDYVLGLVDRIIAERRAVPGSGEGAGDLLDLMLSAQHPDTGARLDDENIRYQIITFLVAGHETTSGALAFALYYLSRNPQVLAQAQAETDAILGTDPNAEPAYEQVAKFRFIRRVIDESLRLAPTVPAFPRSPRAPLTLSTGHHMRPQDWALIAVTATQRDPEVWGHDAEQFNPDRFLPEHSRGRLPHAYKPFGTGERSCIGRQFALHEAVLVLARLLHRYQLTGEPDYTLDITERLTFMPHGLHLTLAPRIPERDSTTADT